jgi:hypothetical protein
MLPFLPMALSSHICSLSSIWPPLLTMVTFPHNGLFSMVPFSHNGSLPLNGLLSSHCLHLSTLISHLHNGTFAHKGPSPSLWLPLLLMISIHNGPLCTISSPHNILSSQYPLFTIAPFPHHGPLSFHHSLLSSQWLPLFTMIPSHHNGSLFS